LTRITFDHYALRGGSIRVTLDHYALRGRLTRISPLPLPSPMQR
jgi:hypothetical protein